MSIRFEKVSKSFGEKKVLNEVTFEAKKSEILFILGRSGQGKSVTLKNIVGLMKPDQGQVFVDQVEVSQLKAEELPQVRKRCGMVFQHPALLDSLTLFENIAFGIQNGSLSQKQIRNRVIEKLHLVNLDESILNKKPPEISYGMQKRASLARTLAPEPEYLLFDEPTTGLDPITTNTINELILSLSKKLKVTSIVVSHDMGCAIRAADQILVLDSGKILFKGDVNEIRKSKIQLIRDFLAEQNEPSAPLGGAP